jgi:phosphatidylinositol-3-phosphatase
VISFKVWRSLLSLLVGLLLVISVGASTVVQTSLPATGCIGKSCRHFDYIVTILMENNGLCDILITNLGGCPGTGSGVYMTSLANTYGLATHYTAITHPSEPNYIALIGGSTYGITSDGNCCFQLPGPNIIDRLESAGLSWQAFAEDASGSGTCSFMPPRAADHFPFLEFSDMNNTTRCSHFLTTASPTDSEFLASLNSPNPANYVWLTPNDTDNMHSSSISTGDNYLANLVPKILSSTLFTTKLAALFIVFDEGNNYCPTGKTSQDCVYAAWIGPAAKLAFTSSNSYSHYSYLSTIESNWGFACLVAGNDCTAPAMAEFFRS